MKWRIDPLGWVFPVNQDTRLLDIDERRRQLKKLQSQEALTNSDVAEFVLGAVMVTVDVKHDMIRTLETKAASQIGFAGAIMAILVTLGRSSIAPPAFLLAVSFLALCIFSNLVAMLVTEKDAPSPLLYNLTTILNDPENKGKIAASLAEAYGRYGLGLGVEAGKKSRYVLMGTLLLSIGVILVVLSSFWPSEQRELSIRCPNERCVVTVTQGVGDDGLSRGQHTGTHAPIRKGNLGRRNHS
jgi:hypothetical protein